MSVTLFNLRTILRIINFSVQHLDMGTVILSTAQSNERSWGAPFPQHAFIEPVLFSTAEYNKLWKDLPEYNRLIYYNSRKEFAHRLFGPIAVLLRTSVVNAC